MTQPNLLDRLLPTRRDSRALLDLALPVVGVQVGMMLMGVVDTVMIGRVSAPALAGVALGNLFFFASVIFGMGVIYALDPLVAQAIYEDRGHSFLTSVKGTLVRDTTDSRLIPSRGSRFSFAWE
ncbi:MAG TPA: MATE family efflux transporter, partial [Gemmatimonadales bacterium]|nr:MATE family efflux transporter [Gemmatimonadales bacterium]